MTPTQSVITALEFNWNMVDAALKDMDDDALARRPDGQSNSVAWILWHMNRVVDNFINTRFQGKAQLWISETWHQRYGMEPNPDDRGVGWTAEQVTGWKPPSREAQLGYYEAVKACATAYLPSMTQADLDRQLVNPPVAEPRPIAALLGQMTWDNVAHGGQIAYLRGLYLGMGWYR